MKDSERIEKLNDAVNKVRMDLMELEYRVAGIRQKAPPVLFLANCAGCKKETTHVSHIDMDTSHFVTCSTAQTSFLQIPIRTCLSCGRKTFEGDE